MSDLRQYFNEPSREPTTPTDWPLPAGPRIEDHPVARARPMNMSPILTGSSPAFAAFLVAPTFTGCHLPGPPN
jgi:hypothetical protein